MRRCCWRGSWARPLPPVHNAAVPTPTCLIRAALPSDEAAWRRLWTGYCGFYDARIPEEVTRRTWLRAAISLRRRLKVR